MCIRDRVRSIEVQSIKSSAEDSTSFSSISEHETKKKIIMKYSLFIIDQFALFFILVKKVRKKKSKKNIEIKGIISKYIASCGINLIFRFNQYRPKSTMIIAEKIN